MFHCSCLLVLPCLECRRADFKSVCSSHQLCFLPPTTSARNHQIQQEPSEPTRLELVPHQQAPWLCRAADLTLHLLLSVGFKATPQHRSWDNETLLCVQKCKSRRVFQNGCWRQETGITVNTSTRNQGNCSLHGDQTEQQHSAATVYQLRSREPTRT